MFLFLMGVDVLSTVGFLFLLTLFGLLAFYVSQILFRKLLKNASEERIDKLSRISAAILAPVLLIAFFVLLWYAVSQSAPKLSAEEEKQLYYETMEEDLRKDLEVGMSKTDVFQIFARGDTTQSVIVYDLSLPEKKGEYMLEITFENGRLTSFRRKQ